MHDPLGASEPHPRPKRMEAQPLTRLLPYLGASGMTALALLLALLIDTYLFVANVALVFLTSVVLAALRWGELPALFACALSVASLNFFFFPPIHDLRVHDPENVVAVLVFIGVAILVGRFASRARANARLAEQRATVTNKLYIFVGRFTSVDDLADLLSLTARQIHEALGLNAIVLLAERDVLALRSAMPPIEFLGEVDLEQAEHCWRRQESGPAAESASCHYLFLPLRAANSILGVVGVGQDGQPASLSREDLRFVEAIADQVALAIQRLTLVTEVHRARVAAETERLRSAMLSAISHDLKTPLASILGAATSLASYSSYYQQQERDELAETIREEAERMNRFVANLLDITRIESSTLEVRQEATDIEEVIGAAARRARRVLGDHRLSLRIAPELPMLAIDGVLLEQVLFNLLDNAAKYAPPGSTVEIEAGRQHDRIIIKVTDEGPGILPQDLQRIFEKFYRSDRGRRQRAGTGLGLAICRGFVEAMGGRIHAGNRTDHSGAVFIIAFPEPPEPLSLPATACDDDD